MGIISIELHANQVPTEPGYYFVLFPKADRPKLVILEKDSGGHNRLSYKIDTSKYLHFIEPRILNSAEFIGAQWSAKLEFRATVETV
jgi:hypothetical protein